VAQEPSWRCSRLGVKGLARTEVRKVRKRSLVDIMMTMMVLK
jgi:hypothetical protein